jgi:hypothetical protein
MARVITPVHPRRYNPNPRGSATTTVLMRAHNPFETRVRLATRQSGSLPGMGALDIDWGNIFEKGISTGIDLVGTAGQNVVNKLIPPPTTTLQAPQATLLPGQPSAGAPGLPVYLPAPAKPSPMPWIIGGVAVLGGVLFMTMRKRR